MDEMTTDERVTTEEEPVIESNHTNSVLSFLKKKRIPPAALIAFGILLLVILSMSIGVLHQTDKKVTPTPTVTPAVTSSPTPTPTPSPSLTPIPSSGMKITISPTVKPSPTPTPKSPTSTTQSNTNTNPSPTSTPVPTATPTPSTGSISGGYYQYAPTVPLTDPRFAVSAISAVGTSTSGDKPRFSMNGLKPGHYTVDIDYDYSKYNPHAVTCVNCTATSTNSTQIQVDLKAGQNLQIEWTFDPK